jgi:hypothetical protein
MPRKPPARRSLDTSTAHLLHLLASAPGLRVRVVDEPCCGERDLRLEVCGEADDVLVEVLCSEDGAPGPDCWSAVRVRHGDRTVWRGPARSGPPGHAVAFVRDLLASGSVEVRNHYEVLG